MLSKTPQGKHYEVLSHNLIPAPPDARSINLINYPLNHGPLSQ
jgi:hypothetical protein